MLRLLAVKKIVVTRKLAVKLEFSLPRAGKHDLTLSMLCDSYVGCDQEHSLPSIDVKEAADSDEESEDEDMEE